MFRLFRLMLVFVFFSFVLSPCFCAEETNTEPVPYSENEFPQWTKDLRRAEIISLGSVPFVALGITIGYGTYLYKTGETEHFPNPFSKGDDSFTEEQQLKILGASLGAGLCIGVIDFTVNKIRRAVKNRREKKILESYDQIIIVPSSDNAEENPDPGSDENKSVQEGK